MSGALHCVCMYVSHDDGGGDDDDDDRSIVLVFIYDLVLYFLSTFESCGPNELFLLAHVPGL